MELIEAGFKREFAEWSIVLPKDDVAIRRRGKIIQSGWAIWYVFGRDVRGEYLDYYIDAVRQVQTAQSLSSLRDADRYLWGLSAMRQLQYDIDRLFRCEVETSTPLDPG